MYGITGHVEAYPPNMKALSKQLLDVVPDRHRKVLPDGGVRGWVTAQFAIEYPEKVERILLNTMDALWPTRS